MRWLWMVAAVVGLLMGLLGGLWLAQGIGIVRIEPIACVGACEPVEAPSLTWSMIGAATLGVAIFIISLAVRRLRRRG